MSPQHLATATAVRNPSRDTVTAHALAYGAAMSQQAFPRAGEILDICLKYSAWSPQEMRDAIASDAALYQAGVRNNPDLAQQWVQAMSPRTNPWLRLRAEAATLEAGGDLVGAWRKLDGFEQKLVSSGREPQLLAFVRKWKVALQNVMPIATPPANPPAAEVAPATTSGG